ncbi:MAG: TolC family protein [Flavobacteriaceae bacterium]
MIKKSFVFVFFSAFSLMVFSQNQPNKFYALEDCIKIALENNLNLQSAKFIEKSAKINYKQSKSNLIPSLNGGYSLGVNNGRSVDPFTNDFIEQRLVFSSANLSLDATVFNGFRLLNSIKQSKLNAKAATLEVEQEKQNLILNVTLAYLQVLNNRDVLILNKKRIQATNKQLKIQKDLYDQGIENPADYTDLLGQKSLDETNILSAQITLNNSKLELLRLMNLTENINLNTKDILLNVDKYKFTSEEVYNDALESLATFQAREFRVEAAKKGVSIAKSQYIPEISLFGRLNTNYSSAAEMFTETGSSIVETGDFITIDNQNIPVQTNQKSFSAQQINYASQFENNLNSVIGVSLRIPFFNGFRAKNNVALERVKVEESLIELERTQLEIKNTIKQIHFDMEAAFARYKSLENLVIAYKKSFEVNNVRFNNGVSNFLAYITSKNNLENAKVNLSNAKYAYFLRVKILEYYRGKSM